MTAIDSAIPTTPPAEESPAAIDPRGALLVRVLDVLDRDGLAYCLLHGYGDYPRTVRSDVDCLMPREAMPKRLAELLRANAASLNARIVTWFQDRAHFIVLETKESPDGPPVLLQLHVGRDYEVSDRLIFGGDDVLRSRRRLGGNEFWIPAGHVEFAATLANRIAKGSIEERHEKQLAALWAAEPIRCSEHLSRLLPAQGAALVSTAAARGDWNHVRSHLKRLRREMMRKLAVTQPASFIVRFLGRQVRRVNRWLATENEGLHVVFLGPDGAGKSTVIEAVQARVSDAFLHTNYQTFARSLLKNKPKESPHALPPRSFAASLLKAAWWLNCYTLGYFTSIYPTIARGGLVINHRYLLDAIVDPKRYRYSGPMHLLRGIWSIAPKPDLVIFLDADPEVIHARKRETTLEETVRQRNAYLDLARTLPNARVISTGQSVEKTVAEVTEVILGHTAARVARRLRLK